MMSYILVCVPESILLDFILTILFFTYNKLKEIAWKIDTLSNGGYLTYLFLYMGIKICYDNCKSVKAFHGYLFTVLKLTMQLAF